MVAFLKLIPDGTTVDPLDAATNAVRGYCGWHIAPQITETIRVDGSGTNRLLIPSGHVVEITECLNDGTAVDLESLDWSEVGILAARHTAGGPYWYREGVAAAGFTRKYRGVQITLTHGYPPEEVPDVVQLIQGVAARARMSAGGNVVQQRAGTQAVTFASSGGAVASLPLLAQEKELLAPYKLNWGP